MATRQAAASDSADRGAADRERGGTGRAARRDGREDDRDTQGQRDRQDERDTREQRDTDGGRDPDGDRRYRGQDDPDTARHDGHGRGRSSRPSGGGRLGAARAAQLGLQQIAEVTGRQADGVAAVEPAEDGWTVSVEVVEDRRIPSSTDVLAIYQADLDQDGELMSYRRIKRYKRGQGDSDYGGESW